MILDNNIRRTLRTKLFAYNATASQNVMTVWQHDELALFWTVWKPLSWHVFNIWYNVSDFAIELSTIVNCAKYVVKK